MARFAAVTAGGVEAESSASGFRLSISLFPAAKIGLAPADTAAGDLLESIASTFIVFPPDLLDADFGTSFLIADFAAVLAATFVKVLAVSFGVLAVSFGVLAATIFGVLAATSGVFGFAGLAVNLPAAKGFSHAGGGRHDGQGRMKRIMAHGVAPRQAGKGW